MGQSQNGFLLLHPMKSPMQTLTIIHLYCPTKYDLDQFKQTQIQEINILRNPIAQIFYMVWDVAIC